jgi:dTDP-4-amino-4,6-dideoxygalactose transaminase
LKIGTIVRPVFSELPAQSIPYIYPVLVEPEYVQRLYSLLNASRIPAAYWPDLQPEVRNNPQNHKTAIKMRQSIITLPIHQSLSSKHVNHSGITLQNQVSKLIS